MYLSVYTGLFSRCYAAASAYELVKKYNGKQLTVIWSVQKAPEALACNIAFEDVFDRSSFPGVDVKVINQIVRDENDLKKMIISFDVRGIIKEIYDRNEISKQNRSIEKLRRSHTEIDFHPPKGMLWWSKEYPVYAKEQSDRVIDLCKTGKSDALFVHVNSSIFMGQEQDDLSCIKFNRECVSRADKIMNNCKNVIGLHLRRTDHGTAITQSPTDIFIKKIDEEISRDDSIRFFLATDSESEQENLIKRYGNRIMIQDNKEWGRSSREQMYSGIIDVLCLSMCDKIYGSCGSVFSKFSAEYGNKELVIVTE